MLYCKKIFGLYGFKLGILLLVACSASWATQATSMNQNQLKQWLQKNSDTSNQADDSTESSDVVATQDDLYESHPKSLAEIANAPESEEAFSALLQNNIPLSPAQIMSLRKNIDLSQRAAAVPANVPPKPVSTTLAINLSPGTTAPAIRLAQGYVSSLVFVDSTGAPWPIMGYQIGNPKATNVQWDGKSNLLMLQAVAAYNDGNIVVRLTNLATPITLELIAGQKVVDFRVDLHVNGLGPNAQPMQTNTNLPQGSNQILMQILDGIAPEDSKTLDIHGADCQGWLKGDIMYLRTKFTVLSPGWIAKITSSDGMQAYEVPRSSSVLISNNGEPVALRIEGL